MFFFSIIPGTKKSTMYRWLAINGMMNQILHGKWLFNQTSIKTGCLEFQVYVLGI